MRARAIRAVYDNGMTGLEGRSGYGVFRRPIYGPIQMIETSRRNRVDQIVLRDMDYAMPVLARPGALAGAGRPDQHNQAAIWCWKIGSHLTKSGSRGSDG